MRTRGCYTPPGQVRLDFNDVFVKTLGECQQDAVYVESAVMAKVLCRPVTGGFGTLIQRTVFDSVFRRVEPGRVPVYRFMDSGPEAADDWIRKMDAMGMAFHLDDDPATVIAGAQPGQPRLFTDMEAEYVRAVVCAISRIPDYDPFSLLVDLAS